MLRVLPAGISRVRSPNDAETSAMSVSAPGFVTVAASTALPATHRVVASTGTAWASVTSTVSCTVSTVTSSSGSMSSTGMPSASKWTRRTNMSRPVRPL